MVNVDRVICVSADGGVIYRGVHRGNMSEEEVGVSME